VVRICENDGKYIQQQNQQNGSTAHRSDGRQHALHNDRELGEKAHELTHTCDSSQSKQPQQIHINRQLVSTQNLKNPSLKDHNEN